MQKPLTAIEEAPPLIIDLDGTLLRTNLLLECLVLYLRRAPLGLFRLFAWLASGRAVLKRRLAASVQLDVAELPINEAVAAYIHREKSKGRRIYLATAADRSLADRVALQCGYFDGVLASDGQTNLKGRNKATALCRLFPSGFSYVGDSPADIPVWAKTKEIVAVGCDARTRRKVKRLSKPTLFFPSPSVLPALLQAARPHQWAKNILVFVPAVLSGQIYNLFVDVRLLACFVALCLVASSTYLLNDIWDLSDDRRHWSKRNRPIASGALPIGTAMLAAPVGLVAGILVGWLAAPGVALVLLCYVAVTLMYSFNLKRIPIVDVTTLAGLFTLRLLLGSVAVHVAASQWLLVFSMLLFSSLCFAKRYVEVERSGDSGTMAVTGRGYVSRDSQLLFSFGSAAGVSSVVLLVLYIIFDAFTETFYGNTNWLWMMPVVLLLWIARVWLVAGRGELDDDPVAFAMRDKPSLMLGILMVAAFALAWSGAFK
jgi:4-hydroxybenzoate polyprenyltransferase